MIKQCINRIAGVLGIKRLMFIAPQAREGVSLPISYAITVCNEAEPLRHLLDFLLPYCRPQDEIIVQADQLQVTDAVKQVIKAYPSIRYVEHALNYDFARAKNHLTEQCRGAWIFQLDADECPQEWFMEHLQAILQANTNVELLKIPRMNLFLDEQGKIEPNRVAWPDYQGRLYRNAPQRIRWFRPLHEKIRGHKAYVYLPKEEKYAIRHLKAKAQDLEKWQQWKQHYA